jgi:hypothetical protein
MKKFFLLIALITINNLFSQEESLVKQFKTDFNFLGIGLSYEIPLSEKWTVDLSSGVGGGYRIESGFAAEWILNSPLAGYLKSEFKYYYNREKREKKGKKNINNSGNYFAFQTKYNSRRFSLSETELPLENALLSEIHWGIQSSLGENWLFNFHLGIGYARNLDFSNSSIYPAVGIKFSYKLF